MLFTVQMIISFSFSFNFQPSFHHRRLLPTIQVLNFFYSADPSCEWKTVSNGKVEVIYRKKHLPKSTALKVLKMSTDILTRSEKFWGWKIRGKLYIVIADDKREANGFATVFPFNAVAIFLHPPVNSPTLMNYDDYLYALLHHEITHIVSLNIVYGWFNRTFNAVFGKIIYPSAFSPNFNIEGVAVWRESSDGFGRNNYPLFERILIEDLSKNGVPSFTETANSHYKFASWYVYGGLFYRYLEKKYGAEKVRDAFTNACSGLVIFSFSDFAETLGTPDIEKDFWEFTTNELSKADRTKSTSQIVEELGLGSSADAGGNIFAFIKSEISDRPKLVITDGKIRKELFSGHFPVEVAVSPDGKRIAVVLLEERTFSSEKVLKVLSYPSLSEQFELTNAFALSFTPSGDLIFAKGTADGRSEIFTLKPDGKVEKIKFAEPQEGVVRAVKNPAGMFVFVRRNGTTEIYRFKHSLPEIFPLTVSNVVIYPSVSKSGDIVFAEMLSFRESRIIKITADYQVKVASVPDVLLKAFEFKGKIYGIAVKSDGYALVEYENLEFLPADQIPDRQIFVVKEEKLKPEKVNVESEKTNKIIISRSFGKQQMLEAGQYEEGDYSVFPSVLPSFWFPVFFASKNTFEGGVFSMGSDVMGLAGWTAYAGMGSEFSSNYVYGEFSFRKTVIGSLYSGFDIDGKFTKHSTEASIFIPLGMVYTRDQMSAGVEVSGGVNWENDSTTSSAQFNFYISTAYTPSGRIYPKYGGFVIVVAENQWKNQIDIKNTLTTVKLGHYFPISDASAVSGMVYTTVPRTRSFYESRYGIAPIQVGIEGVGKIAEISWGWRSVIPTFFNSLWGIFGSYADTQNTENASISIYGGIATDITVFYHGRLLAGGIYRVSVSESGEITKQISLVLTLLTLQQTKCSPIKSIFNL